MDTTQRENDPWPRNKAFDVGLYKFDGGGMYTYASKKDLYSSTEENTVLAINSLGVLVHPKTKFGIVLLDKRYRGYEGGTDSVLKVVVFDTINGFEN